MTIDESAAVWVLTDPALDESSWRQEREAWSRYAGEILAQLGVAGDEIAADTLTELPAGGLLLIPAVPRLTVDQITALTGWVGAGGALVILSDPGPLDTLAGVREGDRIADGHVTFRPDSIWTRPPDRPLHAFGGVGLTILDTDTTTTIADWTRPTSAAAATVRQEGDGLVVVLGADLCQSVVRIRQGWPIDGDGEPAADGTVPIDDGILRCEDGLALSYDHDRGMAPGAPDLSADFQHVNPPMAPAPMFDRPQADLWISQLLDTLTWAAERIGRPLARLDYWPHGVFAVAHMSHDSDSNTNESAFAALYAFARAQVNVTWCVLHPGGYAKALYPVIEAAGHEIALHYNAMGDTPEDQWGQQYVRLQRDWLLTEAQLDRPLVSNKNHYTRWEGWDDFYRWCERTGIQIDQSRGPSKQGDVGFPFGSCHAWRPLTGHEDGNRVADVLCLPLHTQDLWWTADERDREVILDQAIAEHGVAHFLYHGRNMFRHPEVIESVVATANAARLRGLPWWTSERINSWERARRGVKVSVRPAADGWVVEATATEAVEDAAVLVTLPGVGSAREIEVDSSAATVAEVARHGRVWLELWCHLSPGENVFVLHRRDDKERAR